jgi:uroporphyrinogen-III decarboxylase
MLNKELYDTFCLPYLKQIVDSIDEVPVIVFAKGAYFSHKELTQLGSDVMGLDWTISAEVFRAQYGYDQVVQGNLDPRRRQNLYKDRKKSQLSIYSVESKCVVFSLSVTYI